MGDFGRQAARGFAFGSGFSLAAAIVWVVAQQFAGLFAEVGAWMGAEPPSPARTAAVAAIANAPSRTVRVSEHRVERRHGDAIVLGTLHNDSSELARAVRIEAAFYDANGRLVDLCGWYVAPSLAPGEDKPFKVACGGTPERPAPESATVRLRLVEAF